MPSLGKLLSNGSKSTAVSDGGSKKTRGRSSSDKKSHDQIQAMPRLPTPPYIDRSTSDSYFAAPKRRYTSYGDSAFTNTDDYGFPVAEYTQSPGEEEPVAEAPKTLTKGKCRTCDKSVQTTSRSTWRCDQCSTVNLVAPAGRSDTDRGSKRVSINRTQDVLDHSLPQGVKRLDDKRQDVNRPTSSGKTGAGPPDRSSRMSTIGPPNGKMPDNPRRGSAPSGARPQIQQSQSMSHGNQTMRRKSPGPLPLNGSNRLPSGQNGMPSPGPLTAPTVPPLPQFPPHWPLGTPSPKAPVELTHRRPRNDPLREAFRPIFDHLFESLQRPNLNVSFSTIRAHHHGRSMGDQTTRTPLKKFQEARSETPPPQISQMDHKDLMVGDVYDVASSLVTQRTSPSKQSQTNRDPSAPKLVSQGSPHIDWKLIQKWWDVVLGIGLKSSGLLSDQTNEKVTEQSSPGDSRSQQIMEDLGFMVRNTVLELEEMLLTSPQQPPMEPEDIRYLLILLASPLCANPKLYPVRASRRTRSATLPGSHDSHATRQHSPHKPNRGMWSSSKQARILSLVLGQLASLPTECHSYILGWVSRYPEDVFRQHVDMLLGFINERISLRHFGSDTPRKSRKSAAYNGVATSQMFDDILQSDFIPVHEGRSQDWQLRSACKVLQIFVRANDIFHRKTMNGRPHNAGLSSTRRRPSIKQLIPTEYFYNSQLDSEAKFNPRKDFDEWEKKEPGLQLSQYPFLLTLGTKIQILEFDARKKMASKARQEFFDSLTRNTSAEKFFHLKVRRKCIIEDSLQRISEALNASEEEAKKALKVHFEDEEGVDAGGLRKEWFLLLVKELLDPDVGLFLYNEETNFCYFNPASLESSEQYQLVGAVLGLAIYNFTILDVPFPPFLFRKLAAAAPPNMGQDVHQGWRPNWRPDIGDLAQFDPALARNLQQILDYEGNIANDIGAVFSVDNVQFGRVQHFPLVPNGEHRIVNKKNREEYVDLYVDFLLDRAVRRQFEPFARGFFNVCGGNALSLFRGEEIELLIRGSGDLNFSVLRGSVTYENWKLDDESPEIKLPAQVEANFPVVRWFWELMELSDIDDQRRVLRWITGSDRIPATGIGSLILRIQCLGDDCERLPQSRTCFNMLQLWNYASRRSFINKFWYAVVESEGFGLK